MQAWLFTNTFYGNWLPGDKRGSVTNVRDHRVGDQPSEFRIRHNHFGAPPEPPNEMLERAAQAQLKGPNIRFDTFEAGVLLTQLRETAEYRGWRLICASVMWNHLHWIAFVDEKTPAKKALADFKAYGSRALNRRFGKPVSGTWWTSKGSTRPLFDDDALANAVNYVLYEQPQPLLTWHYDKKL